MGWGFLVGAVFGFLIAITEYGAKPCQIMPSRLNISFAQGTSIRGSEADTNLNFPFPAFCFSPHELAARLCNYQAGLSLPASFQAEWTHSKNTS